MGEEFDHLRRHLGAGAANEGAGPAGEENRMLALSVVSSEVGEMRTRLEALSQRLEQAETGRQGDVRHLRQEVEALRSEMTRIGQGVVELSEALASTAGNEDAEADGAGSEPPPQPWDWSSMDWREELAALRVLVEWMPELHRAWGPALSAGTAGAAIPECWVQHPDMRRQVSALYVAYQQAFSASQRRAHHETDWYRVLHERLHDIAQLAKTYKCGTDEHLVARGPAMDKWQTYLRHQVLRRALEAQRSGDGEELARIRTEFDVTDAELHEVGRTRRERAEERFAELAGRDDADAVCEAARLLLDHDLVAADDVSQAVVVAQLAKQLGALASRARPGRRGTGADRAITLQTRLRDRYGPMLQRYRAVHEVIEQMVEQQQARQGGEQEREQQLATAINQRIAEQHITDEEIEAVWHQGRGG